MSINSFAWPATIGYMSFHPPQQSIGSVVTVVQELEYLPHQISDIRYWIVPSPHSSSSFEPSTNFLRSYTTLCCIVVLLDSQSIHNPFCDFHTSNRIVWEIPGVVPLIFVKMMRFVVLFHRWDTLLSTPRRVTFIALAIWNTSVAMANGNSLALAAMLINQGWGFHAPRWFSAACVCPLKDYHWKAIRFIRGTNPFVSE